jgi:curved DNA-binding protein CbpA
MEETVRDERDAYTVLCVDRRAGESSIRSAYRVLARRYHPDGIEPDQRRMTEINVAYDELKTPERRAHYDARHRLVAVGPGVPNYRPDGPLHAGPLARRRAANLQDDGAIVDFGRYAGWRITDIASHDPDYLRWLSRHSTGIRYRSAIERCLPGETELGRRSAWVR